MKKNFKLISCLFFLASACGGNNDSKSEVAGKEHYMSNAQITGIQYICLGGNYKKLNDCGKGAYFLERKSKKVLVKKGHKKYEIQTFGYPKACKRFRRCKN